MDIRKVLNDGFNTKDKQVYNFLTINGRRTPKEIWIGADLLGEEVVDMTKKGVMAKIKRSNRVIQEEGLAL